MKKKILLVDDRPDNLLSMETILDKDGYELVKADSGRQALKILLTEFDFALILMDVKMPNLNGFETAELIYEREKLKHIPIVFITANNLGEEHMFKGYSTGAVDYIYKPVNPELLRAKVSVYIDLYTKNRQLIAQEQKLKIINKNLENEIKERKKMSEAMVKMMTGTLGPKTATSTAASAIGGKDMTTSSVRITDSSASLREVAASAPRAEPRTRASRVAPRPMTRE